MKSTIDMARESWIDVYGLGHDRAKFIEALKHFECLVRADEREVCAKVWPDWKAEYLRSVESGCITLDELREANAELDATNRQVEILSDALAESWRGVDAMIALARADEREACWRTAENYDTGYQAAAAIRVRGNT